MLLPNLALAQTEGVPLWSTAFSGSTYTFPTALTSDKFGNIYGYFSFDRSFTKDGITLTSAGGYDLAVYKLNSTGGLQWMTRFGGTGNEDNIGSK